MHFLKKNFLKVKSEKYWAVPGEKKTYDNVIVEGQNEVSYGEFCCTHLTVTNTNDNVCAIICLGFRRFNE